MEGAIAFGQPAAKADFRYIAYLFGDNDDDFGCGGMLIHPRAVLTAAHCMHEEDAKGRFRRSANPASVRVGAWRWSTDDDVLRPAYEDRTVVYAATHPNYNVDTDNLDIAILVLDSPITSIRPVALAPSGMRLTAGEPLWAAGWGATQFGDDEADALLKVQLPFVTNARCAALRVGRPPSHICAGAGASRGDTCPGDSGGPLVKKARGVADVLVGITSFGPDKDCGQASTGVYTFVGDPTVRRWIAWALQGL